MDDFDKGLLPDCREDRFDGLEVDIRSLYCDTPPAAMFRYRRGPRSQRKPNVSETLQDRPPGTR